MTRGCLVRTKEVKPNTRGKEYLDQLLSKELCGEWVMLRREDIKPLLAIRAVSNAREDYEVSEDQLKAFIIREKLVTENSLIREVLSDPSGQLPDGLVDDESVFISVPVPEEETPNRISNPIPDPPEIVNFEVAIDNLLKKLNL
jgi:hypothetical protein